MPFLRAAVIGLAIIWVFGTVDAPAAARRFRHGIFSPRLASGGERIVIPSLWWPGLLVVGFGAASWARRRWPQTSEWKPRAGDRIHGSRAAMVLGLVGILCGLFVLIDPRWLLDAFFGGRAAPAAYEALTYTETFRQRQAPWLLVLLMLNVPLMIAVIVNDRWSALMRRIEMGLSLATCAVLVWTVLDGPVFMAPSSDRTVKFALVRHRRAHADRHRYQGAPERQADSAPADSRLARLRLGKTPVVELFLVEAQQVTDLVLDRDADLALSSSRSAQDIRRRLRRKR